MALGLMMCCRPELRQEARLEQRLEQRLVLAQNLGIQLGLLNDGNKEALYEIFQLERYQKLLNKGFSAFEDWKQFLAKESTAKAVKPKFSSRGNLSPKMRSQVRLPELAQALLNLTDHCPQNSCLEDTYLNWRSWQLLVIKLSLAMAHANALPSSIWQSYQNKLSEHTADDCLNERDYQNAFWSLLTLHQDGAGNDIAAIIELVPFFLQRLSLTEVTSLLAYLAKETKNSAKDFDQLKMQLEDIQACLNTADKFCFAITVILQNIHYKAGSLIDYPLSSLDWQQCFEQPERLELLQALKNLPLSLGFLILTKYQFEMPQAREIIAKLEELTTDKHFQKSRDDKRLLWRCLNIFRYAGQAEKSLCHFISLANSCEELLRGLQAIEMLSLRSRSDLNYPADCASMEDLVYQVENGTKAMYKKILNLSDEELNLLTQDNIWQLVARNGLLEMCFTYASLCKANGYERGAELASETLKQAMAKHFDHWRYSNKTSGKQINFLSNPKAWKDDHRHAMIVGLTDALQQRLNAIQRLAGQLAVLWEKHTGKPVTSDIDAENEDLVKKLRGTDLSPEERKQIGARLGQIKKEYGLIKIICELLKINAITVTMLKDIQRHLSQIAQKLGTSEAKELTQQIIELLNSTDTSAISHLTFEDSDKPYELMKVGTLPVQSCQRWHEWTGHNQCLAAYVVDANKRVLWIRNNHFDIIGRSIMRLLPFEYGHTDKETIPLLLMERPYCKAWSREIGIGMLQWLIAKAGKISRDNDLPVMIAVKDQELVDLLKEVLPKSKIKTRTLRLELPPSLNEFEYSDSMGGDLKSGAKIVDREFHTFFVGSDPDED